MRGTMSHCISTYLMSVGIELALCQACVLGSTAATVATTGKYGIMKKISVTVVDVEESQVDSNAI